MPKVSSYDMHFSPFPPFCASQEAEINDWFKRYEGQLSRQIIKNFNVVTAFRRVSMNGRPAVGERGKVTWYELRNLIKADPAFQELNATLISNKLNTYAFDTIIAAHENRGVAAAIFGATTSDARKALDHIQKKYPDIAQLQAERKPDEYMATLLPFNDKMQSKVRTWFNRYESDLTADQIDCYRIIEESRCAQRRHEYWRHGCQVSVTNVAARTGKAVAWVKQILKEVDQIGMVAAIFGGEHSAARMALEKCEERYSGDVYPGTTIFLRPVHQKKFLKLGGVKWLNEILADTKA